MKKETHNINVSSYRIMGITRLSNAYRLRGNKKMYEVQLDIDLFETCPELRDELFFDMGDFDN
jgi:hypothetical protein